MMWNHFPRTIIFPDLITDGPRRANQVEKQKET